VRDVKRIERIIGLIRKVWYKNPDLRLTQLIMNTLRIHNDPYYIEDDALEKALKNYYELTEEDT
jgi:uncharacterized protein YihD (DUF1040 family)